jgi:hypothetical protein
VRVGGRLILNEAWPSKRLTGCVDLREERQHETTFFYTFFQSLAAICCLSRYSTETLLLHWTITDMPAGPSQANGYHGYHGYHGYIWLWRDDSCHHATRRHVDSSTRSTAPWSRGQGLWLCTADCGQTAHERAVSSLKMSTPWIKVTSEVIESCLSYLCGHPDRFIALQNQQGLVQICSVGFQI